MEYRIQPCTRRCARTGRVLAPGERYHSVLYERHGTLVREDISDEAWTGPPAQAFACWTGVVPPADRPRRWYVPADVLREAFERLASSTDRYGLRLRYVLALWLVRRRHLKWHGTQRLDGQEMLILLDPKSQKTYTVPEPRLTEDELQTIEDELLQLVGAET
ncbi:MAG: hypothetical protein C4296_14380 [Gemmataceae bacterium]